MPADDLERIENALRRAGEVFAAATPEERAARLKEGGDPVTLVEQAVDRILRETLLGPGEGWLSEETEDDPARLGKSRVWVVDPLDGTREFVEGIPEYGVSIGLVQDGDAVAGGLLNPATGEIFLGAAGGEGVRYVGRDAVVAAGRRDLDGATVLASRSEWKKGLWDRFRDAPFRTVPMGSVAYKLARVAAGLADATWTLVPKHEWDVAGGVALVRAGGGFASLPDGAALRFNAPRPLLPGLVAASAAVAPRVREFLGRAQGS